MKSAPSERTRVQRRSARGRYDRDAVHAVLDATLVGHVATVVKGEPRVLPTAVWRVGEEAVVHGAKGNGLLGALADGAPFALSVTRVDGLVMARSAFHHSMNYRSLVAFGHARVLEDLDELRAASIALLEKMCAGRSEVARLPTDAELQATRMCALPLDEACVKIREGGVADDPSDLDWPCWAGVVPTALQFGAPLTTEGVLAGCSPPIGPFVA